MGAETTESSQKNSSKGSGKKGGSSSQGSSSTSDRSSSRSGGSSRSSSSGDPSSSSTSSSSTSESGDAKKTVNRKPLWVAIPASYEEVPHVDGEGNETTKKQPATYHFYKCDGKPDVRKALAKHNVDVSNIKDVVVLRAHPIEFKAQTQVSLKF